jgi:hypothetical protein
MPLPTLLEGAHQVQFEVWTGPGGRDGVRAKHATSNFFVKSSFGDAGAGAEDEDQGAEEARYSTMRCVGGIQQFPFALQRADQFWGTLADEPPHSTTPPDFARQRVCEFRSVCWAGGALTFFRDSASAASAPSHVLLHRSPSRRGEGFLALSYMHDGAPSGAPEQSLPAPLWSPAVVDEPIPANFGFSSSSSSSSFSSSTAPLHLLDSPAFAGKVIDLLVSEYSDGVFRRFVSLVPPWHTPSPT